MADFIAESELILNKDGSVYHLNLSPEDVSPIIITVGDPARVDSVCAHFDSIEKTVVKREFHTKTGTYKNKRITVISTGIGTDNIDIVFNELDALFNIDLTSRKVKETFTPLTFVRIGTSGALQEDIEVDSIIVSEYAFGLDSLMHFYERELKLKEFDLEQAIIASIPNGIKFGYLSLASKELFKHFRSMGRTGLTVTCPGFYAPQGRTLRLKTKFSSLMADLKAFNYKGYRVTNFEMETSGIYGLSSALGHKALSINAILANRTTNTFSQHPEETVNRTILSTLEKISELD